MQIYEKQEYWRRGSVEAQWTDECRPYA